MALQKIEELNKPPVVGKYYLVPCVDIHEELIPIRLPIHDDAEYLRVPQRHVHYDFRFLSKTWLDSLEDNIAYYFKADQKETYYSSIHSIGITPDIIYKKKLCKRLPNSFPDWIFNINRKFQEFEKAFLGCKLKPNLVCPHKGISLKSEPIKDGIVVCPGHGLAFDISTGECVSRRKEVCNEN